MKYLLVEINNKFKLNLCLNNYTELHRVLRFSNLVKTSPVKISQKCGGIFALHAYYNAHLEYFSFKFFTNLYILIRVFSKTTTMKKTSLILLSILIAMSSLAQKVKTSAANAAQGLSKEEKQVMAWIDAHMPQAIEMLKESVNINSC